MTDELIANVEAWHNERCDSHDSCGCFERLLALVRGEPDPFHEAYRWPVLNFNLSEPRIAEWRAMGRTEFTRYELQQERMAQIGDDMMQQLYAAELWIPDEHGGLARRLGAKS